tara:strand:- start:2891 stop:4015 length:1125 start_codon:yes stop_codon:yes gene_type:complete
MNTITVVLLAIVLSLTVTSIIVGAVIASKKHSPPTSHTKNGNSGDASSSHSPSTDKSGGDKNKGGSTSPITSNTHSTTMEDQPDSSVQILNNTSKEPLHVFFQVKDMREKWSKLGGNGKIYPPVDWGAKGMAWNPVGALMLAEAIIPKEGSITLQIPEGDKVFRIVPVDMKSDSYNPLPAGTNPMNLVSEQWPCLIEGGKDVVADASAVDGVNFSQYYELTTDNGKQAYTTFKGNPCEGIGDQFQLDIGCRNPAKVLCDGPTCDCGPQPYGCANAQQDCAFNKCSKKLFDIPTNLLKYYEKCDGGNQKGAPVKKFINDATHLKDNTPLKEFADSVNGTGDFHTYAYDYNDPGASPYLRSPYKIRVVYSDLTETN